MEANLLSFIIPAHNEAHEIGRTLKSILDSARAVGKPFEVIVMNDASTDRTAEIARQTGARVLDVHLRKISAVRNAGAREAKGDVFFFIDADTQISDRTLRAALSALEQGAAGGGAWVTFAEPVGLGVRLAINLFSFFYMRLARWAAGCFFYARREAFEVAGGFDETLYACEEIVLSIALKRRGRFVLLREGVTTSARKIRLYSSWRIVPLTVRLLLQGPALFRQREGLEWWYEGKREKD
jgi:glycosyltransferase involved in cell wall biosynthesis